MSITSRAFFESRTGASVWTCACGCDAQVVVGRALRRLADPKDPRFFAFEHGPAWALEGPRWDGGPLAEEKAAAPVTVSKEFDDPERTQPMGNWPQPSPIVEDEREFNELAELFNVKISDLEVGE